MTPPLLCHARGEAMNRRTWLKWATAAPVYGVIFAKMNAVYQQYFAERVKPARTTIQQIDPGKRDLTISIISSRGRTRRRPAHRIYACGGVSLPGQPFRLLLSGSLTRISRTH